MAQLPSDRFLTKLTNSLFRDESEQVRFRDALLSQKERFSALIWRDQPQLLEKTLLEASWLPNFVTFVPASTSPGKHPLHEKGAYYCFDPSSAFEGSVLTGITEPTKNILDLCSSPGGKSIFAWRLLQPELLIANEAIRKRLGALTSNLERLKVAGAKVTCSDVSFFSNTLSDSFDLVIVDAPCSGQSLILKGVENPGGFNPRTIEQNALRQRRIIANAARCVRDGGYLAYMTCTFSKEENEEIIEWLLKKFPEFTSINVDSLESYRSHLTEENVYRMWPWDEFGVGGAACLLQKSGAASKHSLDLAGIRFVAEF